MTSATTTAEAATADEHLQLVGAMKTRGCARSSAPHKPLLVLLTIWGRALELAQPRLSSHTDYTEARPLMVELLTGGADLGRRPRPWYLFVPVTNERCWELHGPGPLDDAVTSTTARGAAAGSFHATFDGCLADHDVADPVAATWLPDMLAADLNALDPEPAATC